MRSYALGIIYTRKCNSKCKICGMSSSPHIDSKLDVDEAKEYIDISSEVFMKKKPIIAISGGEPFLFLDEIKKIIRYCNKNKSRRISITSNGFWARDYEETLNIMNELDKIGLDHLRISSDIYHNEYVPYNNIKNIMDASKSVFFRVNITNTVIGNDYSISEIVENLQESLFGIDIVQSPGHPIGRALNYFNESDFYYNSLSSICKEQGMITIDADANVYPCGSIWSFNKNRVMGNARVENLKDIILKVENDKHSNFIAEHGIKPYIEYIQDSYELEDKFVDDCHACGYIFNTFDIDYLDDVLDKILSTV